MFDETKNIKKIKNVIGYVKGSIYDISFSFAKIEIQEDFIKKFCKDKKLKLIKIIYNLDDSTFNVQESFRSELFNLANKNKHVDAVIVSKLTNISKSYFDVRKFYDYITNLNLNIISVHENINVYPSYVKLEDLIPELDDFTRLEKDLKTISLIHSGPREIRNPSPQISKGGI